MICMICMNQVSDDTIICPICGAMPWRMPDAFLNPEQHKAWLTEVYEPQLMRWNHVLQREKRIKELLNENERLKQEIRSLQRNATGLETKTTNKTMSISPSKPKPSVTSGLTLTTNDFVIKDGILSECRSSISIAEIPNGVTSIGTSCFAGCNTLVKVIIPQSVGTIGFWAFAKCEKLSNVHMSNGITVIGGFCFYGCVSLKNIAIPQRVNYIWDSAFAYCESLTEVTIPPNVTTLGKVAFAGCINLKIANVPNRLKVPDNCFPTTCRVIRY